MSESIERIWQSYHAGLRGFIRSRVGDDSAAEAEASGDSQSSAASADEAACRAAALFKE